MQVNKHAWMTETPRVTPVPSGSTAVSFSCENQRMSLASTTPMNTRPAQREQAARKPKCGKSCGNQANATVNKRKEQSNEKSAAQTSGRAEIL
jgi:hypothetical protein